MSSNYEFVDRAFYNMSTKEYAQWRADIEDMSDEEIRTTFRRCGEEGIKNAAEAFAKRALWRRKQAAKSCTYAVCGSLAAMTLWWLGGGDIERNPWLVLFVVVVAIVCTAISESQQPE